MPTSLTKLDLWTLSDIFSNTQRPGRWGWRGTVLHCPGPTKTTTTTPHLNNIVLEAALNPTLDNCRIK
ncbi:hypothetical protein HBI17_254330 [Parastagonospora nodorum]|nr:hypothetical protein HBI17_254330 [Parastagonospora nodorum]